ncbi:MAG: ATP synthase F1 subunit delta [Bdellovibrionales bacterium]|nr:ATP synthase F1 subunit delta [Bdellovibrionales bacterium]
MSVAKRYCRSLTETLLTGNGAAGSMDAHRKELELLVTVISSDARLKSALYGPAASSRDKSAILVELAKQLKLTGTVVNFLRLLARKSRVSLLPEIVQVFDEVSLEGEGGLVGQVVSADPLDDAELERLSQSFTKKLGRRVKLHVSTDPALMAGLWVRVAGVTYDGSLKAQFDRLRERLTNGEAVR